MALRSQVLALCHPLGTADGTDHTPPIHPTVDSTVLSAKGGLLDTVHRKGLPREEVTMILSSWAEECEWQ